MRERELKCSILKLWSDKTMIRCYCQGISGSQACMKMPLYSLNIHLLRGEFIDCIVHGVTKSQTWLSDFCRGASLSSPAQWTWVWVGSRSCWWAGKPGVLQSMRSQTVGHDWATELNWGDHHLLLDGRACLKTARTSSNWNFSRISIYGYFLKMFYAQLSR